MRSKSLESLTLGALALLSAPGFAPAQERATDMSQQLELCVACHGSDGRSLAPEWPSLAAQSELYLIEQLRLLRDGRRYDDTMSPMAKDLDDEMIAALARHFAQLPMPGPTSALLAMSGDSSVDPKAGASLYRKGDPARSLASCASCHGEGGRGRLAEGQPALRGQGAAYIKSQLDRYANGTRYVSKDGSKHQIAAATAMQEIAARLSESERASVAAFIQNMD